MDYKILKLKPNIELPCDYDEESESTGKINCKDLLASKLNLNVELKL